MVNQKGQIQVLIVILVVGLLALGGYLVYQNQTKPTPAPQPTAQPFPSPAISPAPNGTGETTNWKTYTNTKIGFQIKYPSNWEYSEVKAGDPLHLYLYPKHTGDIKSRDPNETLAPIKLLVLNDSDPLHCLAKDNKSCLDLKVDGVSAKKYALEHYHEIVAYKNKRGDLFFELMTPKFDRESFASGSYEEYYSFYNLPEEERKNIFNQILSTFKFTE